MKYVYEEVLSKPLCNPHSRGPSGLKTARMIEDARELVLSHFHTTSDEYEVIFTSGATASLKLLGECFPWSTSSTFCYGYHSHTSLLGMRAYAPIAYCLPSKYMNNFAQSLSTSSSSMIAEGVNDNAKDSHKTTTYHLMAVPGECNFTGVKYPLSHIGSISNTLSKQLLNENAILTKNSSDSSDTHNDDSNDIWLWCLDASKLAATSHIDLSSLSHDVKPDYIVFSFYKIFGYPTGLGALLIKKCKYVHDTITTATTATAISVSTNNMTKDEEYINLQQQSDIKNTSMRIICLPSQILNKK
jgi:molybdenum cofactor sulfurtransferase